MSRPMRVRLVEPQLSGQAHPHRLVLETVALGDDVHVCRWARSRSNQRAALPALRVQDTSKRSRFITLSHAATKSLTNFSCASSLP